jgi:hypothetical protein
VIFDEQNTRTRRRLTLQLPHQEEGASCVRKNKRLQTTSRPSQAERLHGSISSESKEHNYILGIQLCSGSLAESNLVAS